MTKEELKQIPKCSGIYLFINKINGKCYVGQAIDLRKRLQHHLNNLKHNRYNTPLYKAFNKYGVDNFNLKIIKQLTKVKNEHKTKVLDRLEIYFIKYYNSYGSTGYNQTKGGDGGILGYKMTSEQKEKIKQNSIKQAKARRYTVYCLNIHTNEIIKSSNLNEFSKILNIPYGTIKNAKCGNYVTNSKYFISNNKNIKLEYESILKNENISIFNNSGVQNTNYLIEYYNYLISLNKIVSINEIAKNLQLSKDTINKRNKKLKEMGYTLPINSHNKIKEIKLINTISKEESIETIKSLSDKFKIKENSVRDQIKYCEKNNSLYKKTYKFIISYE